MAAPKQTDQVKVYQSLTTPILLAGVPRQFAILNGTFCAALVLGLQSFYALPVCIALHVIGVIFTKKDPNFFSVMLRHLKQKNYYDV
ncbi:MAG: transporter substrate-binding protein [Gammaproteobacteria bacterium]|jgi:type IV secretion system protein VirB3|nr:transporter substrate-binding protein [Gammaproteobacteria bacterium]